MRDLLATAFLLSTSRTVTPATIAGAAGIPYSSVAISASSTDMQLTADPWVGNRTLYVIASWTLLEMEAVSFGFQGTLEVVGLTPLNGVVNVGTASSPKLVLPSCEPWGGGPLAAIVVRDLTGMGGNVCVGASDLDGRNCSAVCGEAAWWLNEHWGFSSAPGQECYGWGPGPDCGTVSIEPWSWGRVRGAYR